MDFGYIIKQATNEGYKRTKNESQGGMFRW